MSAEPWRARYRKVRRELRAPGDALLLGRMACWSVALRFLKYVVPLPTLVRLMRRAPLAVERSREAEARVVTFARWACAVTRTSRRGNCLERGLITYRYLSRLNADPCLVVGARTEETAGSRGHAWVQTGGRVVGEEPEAVEPFTRLLAFDARGNLASPL